MNEKFGTPYYIAPEVLEEDYDYRCDVWSLGVILFVLLSGKPPFFGKNEVEIMNNVAKGAYSLDIPQLEAVGEGAKDLIRKILVKDVDRRFTIQ